MGHRPRYSLTQPTIFIIDDSTNFDHENKNNDKNKKTILMIISDKTYSSSPWPLSSYYEYRKRISDMKTQPHMGDFKLFRLFVAGQGSVTITANNTT